MQRSSVALPWRSHLHVLSVVKLVGVFFFIAAVQPVLAYDWCSQDPIFTFRAVGGVARVVDVQVQVPLSALPLAGPSTLTVTVPSDVTHQVVLNGTITGYKLNVVFVSGPASGGNPTYPVTFSALVVNPGTAFPVRMIVTNPLTLKATTVNGVAGSPVAMTLTLKK